MRSTPRLFLRSCAVLFASAMIAKTCGASSVPSYTATDLGVGTAQLSGTGADATLTSPDGKTVYSFPMTNNMVADPQSLIANFPVLLDPSKLPPSDGSGPLDPHFRFDNWIGPVFLNTNGFAAATEAYGFDGSTTVGGSSVDILQRQANGTFALTSLASGASSPGSLNTGGFRAFAVSLNDLNQLLSFGLGANSFQNFDGPPVLTLANLNTGIVTPLNSLLPGWHIEGGGEALDDQGRILVYASSQATDWQDHAFLLTPAGLSSNPIPAPEPTPFITLAVAGLGLAVRRRWKS
jgi:hypothetical protein